MLPHTLSAFTFWNSLWGSRRDANISKLAVGYRLLLLKADYGDLPPTQPVTKLHDNGRTGLSLTSWGSIRMHGRERNRAEVDTPWPQTADRCCSCLSAGISGSMLRSNHVLPHFRMAGSSCVTKNKHKNCHPKL